MQISFAFRISLAHALRAGAALSVLTAAPSSAEAPVALQLKLLLGTYHTKTNIRDAKNLAKHITSTVDISGTISESEYYKHWEDLWALPAPDCKHLRAKFPKRTSAARIRFVETAAQDELYYKLESKTANSDSFSGAIRERCGRYKAKLIVNTSLNINH